MTTNSLQQLFESLLTSQDKERSPYLLLVQHSQAFELRNEQQAARDDDAVYRSAGLRTPSENAARDWQAGALWLELIAETVHNNIQGVEDGSPLILWIQTITSRRTPQRQDNVRVINCCQDPFGWDDDCDQDSSAVNVDRLESVISAVKKNLQKKTVVLIDSITPIVMRHGLAKTIRFLQKLQQSTRDFCRVIAVPVLVEFLSAKQHMALEDISNAVLSLVGGEAVLLRQGVREKSNTVRETLPYRIIPNTTGDKQIIEIFSANELNAPKDPNTADDLSKDVDATETLSSLSIAGKNETDSRRGKVQLQVNEGSRDTATPALVAEQQQPRIFLQDDDPEFEDYDEEDPDDDLDL